MGRKPVVIFSYAAFLILVLVITLLALDVFTVPYLTPFAHLLKTLISPFVPFLMPLYIGVFIKLYKHVPFPARRKWMLSSACIALQQVPRVLGDLGSLYEFGRLGNGFGLYGLGLEAEGVCGLQDCTGSWAEAALMVGVIVGEWRGWRWDAGCVQGLVDGVAEESIREERSRSAEVEPEVERMEKGEGEKVGLEGRSSREEPQA